MLPQATQSRIAMEPGKRSSNGQEPHVDHNCSLQGVAVSDACDAIFVQLFAYCSSSTCSHASSKPSHCSTCTSSICKALGMSPAWPKRCPGCHTHFQTGAAAAAHSRTLCCFAQWACHWLLTRGWSLLCDHQSGHCVAVLRPQCDARHLSCACLPRCPSRAYVLRCAVLCWQRTCSSAYSCCSGRHTEPLLSTTRSSTSSAPASFLKKPTSPYVKQLARMRFERVTL